MKALVLAGGDARIDPWLRRLAGAAELVVAADGGLRHARPLGLTPDLIVGDFDSAAEADLAHFAGAARERHDRDKAQLDLELALEACWRRGAEAVTVLGAFGGRLDQSLATLLIAARQRREGRSITLHGAGADVQLLLAGEVLTLAAERGATFSLLALEGNAEVEVEGARYPLPRGTPLPYGVGLGVSNRVTTEATVQVHRGLVAVVLERSAPAGSARERIWGDRSERIAAGLREVDPDLAELTLRTAYDDVFERPGLDLRTRELLAVAHLSAMGGDVQLETHVWGALNCGATPEEIRETVIHASMFVGFPRALAAMRVVKRVLARADSAGGNSTT